MSETTLESTITLDLPDRQVGFDVAAFDEAIVAHGIRFVHFRAMRNPVGLVDQYDSRRPDDDNSDASNGMIYTKAGCIQALFTGNSKSIQAQTQGWLDAGVAQITPSRFYAGTSEPVYLYEKDRLYLEEESVLVTTQQLVQAHQTGRDRLRFPAVKVQDLVDARGIRYSCGVDFDVVEGDVVWKTSNRPGINVDSGTGRVYAVRYLLRPFWYIDRMVHEVRVAQQESILGERTVARMPQTAVINREYVYRNEQNNPNAKPSPRQQAAPPEGQFGAR